ncbi:phosphopantetheine-binding protein [Streptomyces sp. NPDC012510]|uniref:acyl carrier protein n=1 Tax=Streptomyces sp. NPDC012510 TaxID=3364838 RepID=UPI0036E05C95
MTVDTCLDTRKGWDDWYDADDASADDAPRKAEVTAPDPAALALADPAERLRVVDRYVREEIGRALGVAPHLIDTSGRPMRSLGVGSIMGMELQHRMEAALHVEVNLQRLLLANSAAELIDCLAGQLGGDGHTHPRAAETSERHRRSGAPVTA